MYEATKEIHVGESDTVKAAATLDQTAPPETVLPGAEVASESGIVVSCLLQARLTVSEDEFDMTDSDWIDRSVYATDTARWVWRVTPKLGGDHTLSLSVRPIVRRRVQGVSDTLLEAYIAAEEANIRDYTIRVRVNVPWTRRPGELGTQVASLLNA